MAGKGHDHYVQIGREATWGTDTAATRRFNVLSTHIQPIRGKVRSDQITGNRNRTTIVNGPQLCRMTMDLEADFEGQLLIWDGAMGTATFGADGGTVTGGPTYTRTFIQRALINSYAVEAVTNIPSGKCDQGLGMKINRLRFSGSTGLDAKPCRISTEWLGKAYTNNVTPTGSLTANTPNLIMPGHVDTANLDVGTADAAGSDRLRSWEISVDNKLAERFYGADTIDEPLTDDFSEVTFKWTMEFTSKTAIDEYLAGTSGTPSFKFASGTKSLQFDAGAGYIVTPVGRPIERWGIYTQEFTFESVHDATYTGLRVIVVNAEATIT